MRSQCNDFIVIVIVIAIVIMIVVGRQGCGCVNCRVGGTPGSGELV